MGRLLVCVTLPICKLEHDKPEPGAFRLPWSQCPSRAFIYSACLGCCQQALAGLYSFTCCISIITIAIACYFIRTPTQ